MTYYNMDGGRIAGLKKLPEVKWFGEAINPKRAT